MIFFSRSHLRASRAGFTLIEVLTVVLIIGVLASLAVPRLARQNEKAVTAEAINIIGNIKAAEFRYRDELGSWFEFADQCTNDQAIRENLDLDLSDSCGANKKWSFEVVVAVGSPTKIRAVRQDGGTSNALEYCLEAGTGCVLGQWTGTGNLAPGAVNWPNLA